MNELARSGAPPGRRSPGAATAPGPSVELVATADAVTVPDPCDLAEHLGREAMYRTGYADGFLAGWDVGAGRVVLAIEDTFGGWAGLLDTPLLAAVGREFREQYRRERAARMADPADRCAVGRRNREHRCSRCIRVLARERNQARYGGPDFPGIEALRRSA